MLRWSRKLARDHEDPHALLKLRAWARRVQQGIRLFGDLIAEWEPDAALATAEDLLDILATPRLHDLKTDYFSELRRLFESDDDEDDEEEDEEEDYDEDEDDEGDEDDDDEDDNELELEALDEWDRVLEEKREKLLAQAKKKLKAVEWDALEGFRDRVQDIALDAEIPPLEEARRIIEGLEETAYQKLKPLLVEFDESVIPKALRALRTLRYALKTMKPCFPADTYAINHVHAHRLQGLLARAQDIEEWTLDASDFHRTRAGKEADVEQETWEKILRAASAQRLNGLHQLSHLPLTRSWLARAGDELGMLHRFRPDLLAARASKKS